MGGGFLFSFGFTVFVLFVVGSFSVVWLLFGRRGRRSVGRRRSIVCIIIVLVVVSAARVVFIFTISRRWSCVLGVFNFFGFFRWVGVGFV